MATVTVKNMSKSTISVDGKMIEPTKTARVNKDKVSEAFLNPKMLKIIDVKADAKKAKEAQKKADALKEKELADKEAEKENETADKEEETKGEDGK